MRDLLHFYTAEHLGSLALNVVVYQLLLIACWVYALARGGAPEKIGATILAIGTYLTIVALSVAGSRFQSVELSVLIIDVISALAFVFLASHADRFWPLWVAALQVLGTAAHAVRFVDPDIAGPTYGFMLAVWSYPMIALIVIGTRRHRARLTRLGADLAWSADSSSSHWHTKRRTLSHG
jgi:hypothetical protein